MREEIFASAAGLVEDVMIYAQRRDFMLSSLLSKEKKKAKPGCVTLDRFVIPAFCRQPSCKGGHKFPGSLANQVFCCGGGGGLFFQARR